VTVDRPAVPADRSWWRRWSVRRWLVFATVLVAVVGVPLALIAVAIVHDRGVAVDEESYIGRNEAVLRDVPVFPGARCSSQTVSWGIASRDRWWPFGDEARYRWYMTERACRLPDSVSSGQVLGFYRERLEPEWRWSGPVPTAGVGPPCEASFRRGEALLLVLTCRSALLVRVDHAAYRS